MRKNNNQNKKQTGNRHHFATHYLEKRSWQLETILLLLLAYDVCKYVCKYILVCMYELYNCTYKTIDKTRGRGVLII